MLRAHTTVHDCELLKKNEQKFIVFGDVYRRDEIDKYHYPIFHQLDGIENSIDYIKQSLFKSLESLISNIFINDDIEFKWVNCSFPFTNPSFEMEIRSVKNNLDWTEVLGCGILHQKILKNCNINDKIGWAFGIGLERIAMIKFGIDDIRLFWTNDDRFFSQFKTESISTKFVPFSKHEASVRDISFWIDSKNIENNDIYNFFRENCEKYVEKVELIDNYIHPKNLKKSKCYRITYRAYNKKLSHTEVNEIHNFLIKKFQNLYNIKLR